MKLFRRRKQRKLDEVLQGQTPPSLPRGLTQLLRLLRDPEARPEDLSEAMSWDPALVVRLLRLVNSSAFGLRRTVDSVSHAVVIVGRAQLEQVVLGVGANQLRRGRR